MIIDNNTIFKLNVKINNDGAEITCLSPKKKNNEELLIKYLNENDSVKNYNSLYLNEDGKIN